MSFIFTDIGHFVPPASVTVKLADLNFKKHGGVDRRFSLGKIAHRYEQIVKAHCLRRWKEGENSPFYSLNIKGGDNGR